MALGLNLVHVRICVNLCASWRLPFGFPLVNCVTNDVDFAHEAGKDRGASESQYTAEASGQPCCRRDESSARTTCAMRVRR